MPFQPRASSEEYIQEIRRCWDLIALLLQRPPADSTPIVAERERIADSIERVRKSAACRGAGVLIQGDIGATALYADTSTTVPIVEGIGPEWDKDLRSLERFAGETNGKAQIVSIDALPVWDKLRPGCGPAVAAVRSAYGFSPLVCVVCWDGLGPAFTNVALLSCEHELQEIGEFVRGVRMEERANAAQQYVLNALMVLQSVLEAAALTDTTEAPTPQDDKLRELSALVGELKQLKGRLDLAVGWISDTIRPPGASQCLVVEINELVRVAAGKIQATLEESGIEVELLLRSLSSVLTRGFLFDDAFASVTEVARIHCLPSKLRVETRDLGDYAEVIVSWDGYPLSREHLVAANAPNAVVGQSWNDTLLCLNAKQRIALLCGRFTVDGTGGGTSVYINLPISRFPASARGGR